MTTLGSGWLAAARSVDDLLEVLAAGASVREDDDGPARFTQLQHGLQCGLLLQTSFPDDLELQAAGLLHDVGHTLAPGAVEAHGRVAQDWLAELLGERVASLVGLHVPAKRYLVTVDPEYRARLSPDSVRTLVTQGDDLSPAERASFEAEPYHRAALALRRADEMAKVADLDAGSIEDWRPVLRAVVASVRAA